jgi:hypothetical protein
VVRGFWRRSAHQPDAQFGEHPIAAPQIRLAHAQRRHRGTVAAFVDDRQRRFADSRAVDAALRELVGDDQPENRVIGVDGTAGRPGFHIAQHIDHTIGGKRQSRDRTDRAAQIHREIAGIKPCAPRAHCDLRPGLRI